MFAGFGALRPARDRALWVLKEMSLGIHIGKDFGLSIRTSDNKHVYHPPPPLYFGVPNLPRGQIWGGSYNGGGKLYFDDKDCLWREFHKKMGVPHLLLQFFNKNLVVSWFSFFPHASEGRIFGRFGQISKTAKTRRGIFGGGVPPNACRCSKKTKCNLKMWFSNLIFGNSKEK